uniref:Nucleoside-triphosphatase, cancer-related n=1 Tax=Pipistrellus kuhlii TaxID=59472 RepID=A0A7J7TQB8_PIPKU|nr:nucleoside-triphosphatase, cancer-related [Pipistrellus kuhlii]
MGRHVFLTGPPGVGKTTLIQKASEALKSSGVPVDGFYTQEVRQGGRRIGFDVVTLSGLRGPLSRVGAAPPPGTRECRVGQYVAGHQGKQEPPLAGHCEERAERREVSPGWARPPGQQPCPPALH